MNNVSGTLMNLVAVARTTFTTPLIHFQKRIQSTMMRREAESFLRKKFADNADLFHIVMVTVAGFIFLSFCIRTRPVCRIGAPSPSTMLALIELKHHSNKEVL